MKKIHYAAKLSAQCKNSGGVHTRFSRTEYRTQGRAQDFWLGARRPKGRKRAKADSGVGVLREGDSKPTPHQLRDLSERCELPKRGSGRQPKGFPPFSALWMASPDTIILLVVDYHAAILRTSLTGRLSPRFFSTLRYVPVTISSGPRAQISDVPQQISFYCRQSSLVNRIKQSRVTQHWTPATRSRRNFCSLRWT